MMTALIVIGSCVIYLAIGLSSGAAVSRRIVEQRGWHRPYYDSAITSYAEDTTRNLALGWGIAFMLLWPLAIPVALVGLFGWGSWLLIRNSLLPPALRPPPREVR